ncbi:MAG: hypothetical protein ABIS39_01005 [Sphingomicrobium sp.]
MAMDDRLKDEVAGVDAREVKFGRYGVWIAVFLLGVAVGGIAAMALDPPNILYDDAAGASDPRPG